MPVFQDIVVKVSVAVLSAVLIAVIWWAKRKLLQPLIDLYAHLGPLLLDVAELRQLVKAIKAEVETNGGQSLKDKVHRICDTIERIDARQRGLIATQARATFEADPEFNWTLVNRSLEILTTFGLAHLQKRRWVARIHEDDRDDVMDEVHHARRDGRAMSATFRFVTDGEQKTVIAVQLEATPIYSEEHPDKIRIWSGSLAPCKPQE